MRRSVAEAYEVDAVDAVKAEAAEEQLADDDVEGAVIDAASLPASAAKRERADISVAAKGKKEKSVFFFAFFFPLSTPRNFAAIIFFVLFFVLACRFRLCSSSGAASLLLHLYSERRSGA